MTVLTFTFNSYTLSKCSCITLSFHGMQSCSEALMIMTLTGVALCLTLMLVSY